MAQGGGVRRGLGGLKPGNCRKPARAHATWEEIGRPLPSKCAKTTPCTVERSSHPKGLRNRKTSLAGGDLTRRAKQGYKGIIADFGYSEHLGGAILLPACLPISLRFWGLSFAARAVPPRLPSPAAADFTSYSSCASPVAILPLGTRSGWNQPGSSPLKKAWISAGRNIGTTTIDRMTIDCATIDYLPHFEP